MTYARTFAAAATAAIAFALAPQVAVGAVVEPTETSTIERIAAPDPISALPDVEATDLIEGVRIIADTAARAEMATVAVERFAADGWSLTNTEIRWDEAACDGAVGFHAEERGHHVVVMCTEQEWTLLHELGHVWSALYLDDEAKADWISRRNLDSWHDGAYDERGTEQAAQVIAFGLYETAHVPSMPNNDYQTMVEDFSWLFGVDPMHRRSPAAEAVDTTTDARIQVVASRDIVPVGTPVVESSAQVPSAPSEFQFPMACGFPRWNSSHGGFGYTDPRDWTHVGVDLYAFEGTPVISPVHGTVVRAGWAEVAGWRVVVVDRFGYEYRMVHLSQPPAVSAGMTVTAGSRIGTVGRSGNASGGGPHLHFEIRMDGEPIDPMPWLRQTKGDNVEQAPSNFSSTDVPLLSGCNARV